jgi:hypothetical protein
MSLWVIFPAYYDFLQGLTKNIIPDYLVPFFLLTSLTIPSGCSKSTWELQCEKNDGKYRRNDAKPLCERNTLFKNQPCKDDSSNRIK